MTTTPRHIAVVLAAGSGRRTGLDTPKQFCPLAGHPLVAYSLTAFERHPDIAETAVIIHPDYIGEMQEMAPTAGGNCGKSCPADKHAPTPAAQPLRPTARSPTPACCCTTRPDRW